MKQVFLYNLKPEITDEMYDVFLRTYKGPIISRMEHNISFNMLRMLLVWVLGLLQLTNLMGFLI